jgi:uncharacterized protein (TIGR01777 family)
MANITIAGGTGFIGQALQYALSLQGHRVFILTRHPKAPNQFLWDPKHAVIDLSIVGKTDILINLCGENIGGGRWTKDRKQKLKQSRIDTTKFLYQNFKSSTRLKKYIGASGIDCYSKDSSGKIHDESSPFGEDYVAQLVKEWEESADRFSNKCIVQKLRISMVLDKEFGALQKLLPLVKSGFASPIGSGEQTMNWVHIHDAVMAFVHLIESSQSGVFNLTGTPLSNADFMRQFANQLKKPFWMPKVPAFVLKLMFGEMANLLLKGVPADNSALKNLGFEYKYENLGSALSQLFPR